jgi:hypothetical protein
VASSFEELTSSCLHSFSSSGLSGLNAAQIGAMPGAAFAAFAECGSLMPAACAGFTAAQFAKMATSYPNSQCDSCKAACVAQFNGSALASLSKPCFTSLTAAAIGGLTADQLKYVAAADFASFANLGAFNQSACAGLTAAQV